jgi:hypothetical protein
VQFGVFVDRAIDGDQQTLLVEFGQMLVQITVATLMNFRVGGLSAFDFLGRGLGAFFHGGQCGFTWSWNF